MKNKWAKLFGNKKFKYYLNTINLKKNNNNFLHTFNKAKIIYPELNKTKFSKILKFIEKNIKLKKKIFSFRFWVWKWLFYKLFHN